jgi:hypothetical protein
MIYQTITAIDDSTEGSAHFNVEPYQNGDHYYEFDGHTYIDINLTEAQPHYFSYLSEHPLHGDAELD